MAALALAFSALALVLCVGIAVDLGGQVHAQQRARSIAAQAARTAHPKASGGGRVCTIDFAAAGSSLADSPVNPARERSAGRRTPGGRGGRSRSRRRNRPGNAQAKERQIRGELWRVVGPVHPPKGCGESRWTRPISQVTGQRGGRPVRPAQGLVAA